MDRKLQEEFTLPTHPQLLEEINQTIIDLKIQDEDKPLMAEKELLQKLRSEHKKHSLQYLVQLLQRCYTAINQQRHNPRKY